MSTNGFLGIERKLPYGVYFSYMLSRPHRACTRDVRTIASQGKSVHGVFFSVRTLPTPSQKRYATVVSKKVARSAVARNTLKRKMRAALVRLITQLPKDTSITVYAKKDAQKLTVEEIYTELTTLLINSASQSRTLPS